jgi:hypothetical protein
MRVVAVMLLLFVGIAAEATSYSSDLTTTGEHSQALVF